MNGYECSNSNNMNVQINFHMKTNKTVNHNTVSLRGFRKVTW